MPDGALEPREDRRTCAENTSLPDLKGPGGDGYVQSFGLKAVAVVSSRLPNSPATRSETFPGEVVESFQSFEHMDKSKSPKPSSLKNWRAKIEAPPVSKQQAQESNEVSTPKGCLILLVFFFGLFFVASYWNPILLTLGFFGTWVAVAYFGLRAKKSKILSIGGGLMSGTLVSCILGILTGEGRKSNPDESPTNSANNQYATSLPWKKRDLESRKSLAEMKYRDAKDLQGELETLMQRIGNNTITPELVGDARKFRHGVDFISSEIIDAGFRPDLDTADTAMSDIHGALQSMKFAWDNFEQMAKARSSEEAATHASIHANEMKAMRNKLSYARTKMDSGDY